MHDLSLSVDETRRIAHDAYVFGFGFVANYRVFIRRAAERAPIMLGVGFNEFAHYRQVIPAETPDTAQQDTLYSFAVLDLRREPIIISVPDVDEPYSYMLQLGDTSTETLPYISTITTGNRAGRFAVTGPDFQGLLPTDALDGVIAARGQFVVILGRTSILDPDDLAPLHHIQDGMALASLSGQVGTPEPPELPPVEFPAWDEERASSSGVFSYVNAALAWHPPSFAEMPLMAEFARIGIMPGSPFTTDDMSPDVAAAVAAGVADARTEIEANVERFTKRVNGWNWSTDDISRFGSDYLRSTTSPPRCTPTRAGGRTSGTAPLTSCRTRTDPSRSPSPTKNPINPRTGSPHQQDRSTWSCAATALKTESSTATGHLHQYSERETSLESR
jgi:hypothetical protein